MNNFSKLIFTIIVSSGMGLTASNAMAVTFMVKSYLSMPIAFDAQNIASFSDNVASGYTDFNDLFTFSVPSGLGGASVISSFNGLAFSAAFSSFQLLDLTHSTTVAAGSITPNYLGQLSFPSLSADANHGPNIIGTVNNPSAGAYYSGSGRSVPYRNPQNIC